MATAQHTPLPWRKHLNKTGTLFYIEADSQKKHDQALVAKLDWWTNTSRSMENDIIAAIERRVEAEANRAQKETEHA